MNIFMLYNVAVHTLMNAVATTEATLTFDVAWITQLLDLVKNIMGIFMFFPFNLFLGGSLIGLAVWIFKKLKHAVK